MGCNKSKLDKKDFFEKELEFNFEEKISPEKAEEDLEEDPIMKELKLSIPIISIHENYTFSKKIAGQGSFGVVRMVHPKNNESLTFALKSIQKEKVKKTIKILKREVDIMKAIDHPNIVKLYRVYQDHFFFHLLLEYCSGGELLERIIQNPRFSETYATTVIKSMIYALKYLHGMNVCHRDLKPENFVFKDSNFDSDLKLIDFGLAYNFQVLDQEKNMKTVAGSAYYIAPEVHTGKYNFSCDIWSLGVISYLILVGDLPIKGSNPVEILHNLESFDPNESLKSIKHLSIEAKNFLISTLQKDPKKRISSKKAIHHNWFSKGRHKTIDISQNKLNVLEKLHAFKGSQKFKQEAMKIIISMVRKDEIQHLKELFIEMDHDKTGKINIENVEFALKEIGMNKTSQDIENLMDHLKLKKENEINYTDFISAILDQDVLTKERTWAAFKYFDVDNTDYISIDNIKEAMNRAGRNLTEDDVNKMLDECDLLNDGKIRFEEFFYILTNNDLVKVSSEEFLRKNSLEIGSKISIQKEASLSK